MLFTLGCPGEKCASGVLWLEKQEDAAVCDEMVKPSTYPTADFPVKHWSNGPSSLLLTDQCSGMTGALWDGRMLPLSTCVLLMLVGNGRQDLEPRFSLLGGCLEADSPVQVKKPTSLLCDQLKWVQCDVETPSAVSSAFPRDALERESFFIYFWIQTMKYLSEECNI